MASLTVNIPDGKLQFFKNLVENLGFNYTENTEEPYATPKWQQEEVDKRYQDYKKKPKQALDFNDAVNEIDKKYGL